VPTYRLTLEYEGTRYHGWQEQKNARSVAGELRRAVTEAGAVVKDLGGSGRTDAGVHALAQVAHLRLAKTVDPGGFRLAVNDLLPPDIHVLDLAPVSDKFHARHSAEMRSYLYQISRRRTALAKRWVWWVKRPLDERRMGQAASLLPGRHDFRLFCEKPGEQPSTIVVVEGFELATPGALILIRLAASHFLWKMVRRVVGTLVKVGAGELDVAGFERLLAGEAPRSGQSSGLPAEWTAPPSGLFLERVLYPGDPPLAPLEPAVPVAAE
jgi:tRNA pseudouridine38-40 synthase